MPSDKLAAAVAQLAGQLDEITRIVRFEPALLALRVPRVSRWSIGLQVDHILKVLEAGTRLAESLELFSIAASLGSTESLVVPPAMQQPRGMTAEQVAWTGIGPGTVRLSVGIEDADDLVDDLRQALDRAAI